MAAGRIFLQEHNLNEAKKCFEDALASMKKSHADSASIGSCQETLASIYQTLGQTEDALNLYRARLRAVQRHGAKDTSDQFEILIQLGLIAENEGEWSKAVKLYQDACTLMQQDAKASQASAAKAQHLLGRALFESGKLEESRRCYQKSLDLLMQLNDLASSDLLETILADYINILSPPNARGALVSSQFGKELLNDDLGSLQQTKGVPASNWSTQVTAVLTPQQQSSPLEAKSNTSDSLVPPPPAGKPIDSSAQTNAAATALKNINKQRVEFYERMIAVDIQSLGPEHPSVARDLSGLAAIYMKDKDYANAQQLLEKSLTIYRKVYGNDSLVVKRTESLLELLLEAMHPSGDDPILSTEYTKGLPTVPLAAQTLSVAMDLNYLAYLLYSEGDLDDAKKVYSWALSDTVATTGEQSILVAACLQDYSHLLRKSGNETDAQKYVDSARGILHRERMKQSEARVL